MATHKHAHFHRHAGQKRQVPSYVISFITMLLPAAQKAKLKWGVPICVLIAQGAEESGWGRRVKGNAYFGIKGKSPSGNSVNFGTHEEVKGTSVAITADFRAYKDVQEAADDYGRTLATNPNFASAYIFRAQPFVYIDKLAAAGYATNHKYAHNLKSIIRTYGLDAYDKPAAKKP